MPSALCETRYIMMGRLIGGGRRWEGGGGFFEGEGLSLPQGGEEELGCCCVRGVRGEGKLNEGGLVDG